MPTVVSPMDFSDILLRLAAASAAGLVVGWERESHGRAAGLRTTTLTCGAAALAMLISHNLFVEGGGASAGWKPDPARLAAGILTGMGFLGAGTIIRQENLIRGVTTAAVLWSMTIIGLAFGSGYFTIGGVGTVVALVALFILPRIEANIKNDWYGAVVVTSHLDGASETEILHVIEAAGIKVKAMDPEYDLERKVKTTRFELKFKKSGLLQVPTDVVKRIAQLTGVVHVKWT